ncbi:MAG: hypothetical protein WAO35_20150 [Terriglobia bacterium]
MSAPLKTKPFLRRFSSRCSASSLIAQGFAESSSAATDSMLVADAVSSFAGAIQASPAGVSVNLSIDVPFAVARTMNNS